MSSDARRKIRSLRQPTAIHGSSATDVAPQAVDPSPSNVTTKPSSDIGHTATVDCSATLSSPHVSRATEPVADVKDTVVPASADTWAYPNVEQPIIEVHLNTDTPCCDVICQWQQLYQHCLSHCMYRMFSIWGSAVQFCQFIQLLSV